MICPNCGKDKPLTDEHWRAEVRNRTGYRLSKCKVCINTKAMKRYYERKNQDGQIRMLTWWERDPNHAAADYGRFRVEAETARIRAELAETNCQSRA